MGDITASGCNIFHLTVNGKRSVDVAIIPCNKNGHTEAFKLQEIPESYIYPLTSLLSQLRLKWFSFCTGQLFVEVAQSTKKPIRFVICLFLCPAVAEITNSYFVPPPTLWLPLLLLLLLLVPHMILAFSRCPPLP